MGNQFTNSLGQETITRDITLVALDVNTTSNPQNYHPKIQEYLQKYKPFQKQFNQTINKHQIFSNGDIYIGEKNEHEKAHGIGRLLKKNGDLYIGNFKNGIISGEGHYIMTNGNYIDGNFENNLPNGHCKYKSTEYELSANFINGIANGEGVEKAQSYTFTGQFKDGHRHKGKLTWTDFRKNNYEYNGQFSSKNHLQGTGQLKNKKGRYQGSFKLNLKEGYGKFNFLNGILYVGEYSRGFRQGKGIIYNMKKENQVQQREQNISYRGDFSSGLPDGDGQIYNSATKTFMPGKWRNGDNIGHFQ